MDAECCLLLEKVRGSINLWDALRDFVPGMAEVTMASRSITRFRAESLANLAQNLQLVPVKFLGKPKKSTPETKIMIGARADLSSLIYTFFSTPLTRKVPIRGRSPFLFKLSMDEFKGLGFRSKILLFYTQGSLRLQ